MNIDSMDSTLREKVWAVAGRVEWTEADWRDFYDSLTAVFTRIAARHARIKIMEAQHGKDTEGTRGVQGAAHQAGEGSTIRTKAGAT